MSIVENTNYPQSVYNRAETVMEQTAGKTSKKTLKGAGTYGEPKLSDEALEYYNSLKEKYSGMNFVLVASDKKAEADAMKGSFATPGKMTVLIDVDKIERMATDENYRKQIESTIANAASGISDMFSRISSTGANVKAYGMSVNDDGTAEYFAVVDKALEKQRERIEEKTEEKRQQRAEDRKKANRDRIDEKIEKRRDGGADEDTVTITANSPEELLRKLQEYGYENRTNEVMTEEEKMLGSKVDFSV